METISGGEPHHVTDTSTEERWRAFCAEAFAHGVRSCLSLPVRGPAGVVALALRLSEQAKLNDDLHATLATRSIIDQAIGIVMAQQPCPATDAFAVLSRASQNRNINCAPWPPRSSPPSAAALPTIDPTPLPPNKGESRQPARRDALVRRRCSAQTNTCHGR